MTDTKTPAVWTVQVKFVTYSADFLKTGFGDVQRGSFSSSYDVIFDSSGEGSEEFKTSQGNLLRNVETDVQAQRMFKAGKEVIFHHKLNINKQYNASTENVTSFCSRQQGREVTSV